MFNLRKRHNVVVNSDRGLITLLEELNNLNIAKDLKVKKLCEEGDEKWMIFFNANCDEWANLRATVKYCPKFLNMVESM